MSNLKVDYFKATFTSDGNTGNLEVNDNGEQFYKNLNEEDLMKLVNVVNNPSNNSKNLIQQLKSEFPLKKEKSTTKKKNKKSKIEKKSRRTKSTESIESVFN